MISTYRRRKNRRYSDLRQRSGAEGTYEFTIRIADSATVEIHYSDGHPVFSNYSANVCKISFSKTSSSSTRETVEQTQFDEDLYSDTTSTDNCSASTEILKNLATSRLRKRRQRCLQIPPIKLANERLSFAEKTMVKEDPEYFDEIQMLKDEERADRPVELVVVPPSENGDKPFELHLLDEAANKTPNSTEEFEPEKGILIEGNSSDFEEINKPEDEEILADLKQAEMHYHKQSNENGKELRIQHSSQISSNESNQLDEPVESTVSSLLSIKRDDSCELISSDEDMRIPNEESSPTFVLAEEFLPEEIGTLTEGKFAHCAEISHVFEAEEKLEQMYIRQSGKNSCPHMTTTRSALANLAAIAEETKNTALLQLRHQSPSLFYEDDGKIAIIVEETKNTAPLQLRCQSPTLFYENYGKTFKLNLSDEEARKPDNEDLPVLVKDLSTDPITEKYDECLLSEKEILTDGDLAYFEDNDISEADGHSLEIKSVSSNFSPKKRNRRRKKRKVNKEPVAKLGDVENRTLGEDESPQGKGMKLRLADEHLVPIQEKIHLLEAPRKKRKERKKAQKPVVKENLLSTDQNRQHQSDSLEPVIGNDCVLKAFHVETETSHVPVLKDTEKKLSTANHEEVHFGNIPFVARTLPEEGFLTKKKKQQKLFSEWGDTEGILLPNEMECLKDAETVKKQDSSLHSDFGNVPRVEDEGKYLSEEDTLADTKKKKRKRKKEQRKQSQRELFKKVDEILNRIKTLSPKELIKEIQSIELNDEFQLNIVVDAIYEKVFDVPGLCANIAAICQKMLTYTVKVGKKKESETFGKILIRKCQRDFERKQEDELKELWKEAEFKDCKGLELQLLLEEATRKRYRRPIVNCRFIGELFKARIVKADIIVKCMKTLLETPSEECIERLCALLKASGKDFQTVLDTDPNLASFVDKMRYLSEVECNAISSSVRLMLRDYVIGLKKKKNSTWYEEELMDYWDPIHGYDDCLLFPDFLDLVKFAKSSFKALYKVCVMCPHLNFEEVMEMVNGVESIDSEFSYYSDDGRELYSSEEDYVHTQVWF